MAVENIISQILNGASNSSALELVAVLFGFISVWLAKKENIWLYPTGLINVSLFVYICAIYGLYADMGINIYYVIISVYGWFMWTRKGQNSEDILSISVSTITERLLQIGASICFGIIIYFLLIEFTDSSVPLWDATTTGIFIVAMILMARKKIEHWIAWIIGNLISVPLYLYKGLAFTSLQYLIFTILAISGYISWKKKLN